MKWDLIVGIVVKGLDMIHDVLCPFFRDDQKSEDKTTKDQDQPK